MIAPHVHTGNRTNDRVEAGPVLAAIAASDVSWSQIARELGWFVTSPDTNRLRRAVGGAAQPGARNRRKRNETVDYELAVKIARIIGADPVDLGV